MDLLSLSPEDRLILYCARTRMNEATQHEVIKLLNSCPNWDYILKGTIRHGISPLLYRNLRKITARVDVPAEVMTELMERYYNNIDRNLRIYNELSKVLKAFTDAGIDVIVLKGAVLAETVYKNVGLRVIGDVDLLVKKADLDRVKNDLVLLGYHTDPTRWPEELNELWQTEWAEERHYTKKIGIDLHWYIQSTVSPFQININDFWANAKPVKIAGTDAFMFAPDNLLQHLCLHIDRHISNTGTVSFKWYCDLTAVINEYDGEIDWHYQVQSAKTQGLEAPIYHSFYIASTYFGAFVPPYVLNDLKHTNVDFDDPFRSAGIMDCHLRKANRGREFNFLTILTKVDGIGNKARILFRSVFPCKEFMMRYYPIKRKKQIYRYYLYSLGTALRWGLNVLWYVLRYPFKERL